TGRVVAAPYIGCGTTTSHDHHGRFIASEREIVPLGRSINIVNYLHTSRRRHVQTSTRADVCTSTRRHVCTSATSQHVQTSAPLTPSALPRLRPACGSCISVQPSNRRRHQFLDMPIPPVHKLAPLVDRLPFVIGGPHSVPVGMCKAQLNDGVRL